MKFFNFKNTHTSAGVPFDYTVTVDSYFSDQSENISLDLQESIKKVLDAVHNQGTSPAFHKYIMSKHRKEWPTLWAAIDHLNAAYYRKDTDT
jgi:hypothetical protein